MTTDERTYTLEFRWTVSRGRDTYGYNICTLYLDGTRVARCNGGGYDMEGTCLGDFVARNYADRLRFRIREDVAPARYGDESPRFYGLTFHDPHYDPGKAIVGKDTTDRTLGGAEGMTVAEAEKAGKSCGLERYQAIFSASTPFPDARHTIPYIDGACGRRSVEIIMQAIGLTLTYLETGRRGRNRSLFVLHDAGPNAGESR